MTTPTKGAAKQVRCAIYTRKSTDENLTLEFNSLHAQRESAEAYIASQKSQGWVCLPERYDDGGYSGGTTERPALRRLMADIEAGLVDVVLVYKVDRLSRSLLDFGRLMETFEARRVSFVSVTQEINTANSMGRLMLNVLLSFAQFEREIISERTRDKIAAARRKGKWAGGHPILGYDLVRGPGGTKLAVNEEEAQRVRAIFSIYAERRSLQQTIAALDRLGWTTKAWETKAGRPRDGQPFSKSSLHKLLTNVAYRGQVVYRDQTFEGEHPAIVDEDLFLRVQAALRQNGVSSGGATRNRSGALLKGLVRCRACGGGMSHSFTTKGSRMYRYYVCVQAQKQGWSTCPCPSLPAHDLERFVVDQIREQCAADDGAIREAVRRAQDLLRQDRKVDPEAVIDEDEMVGALEAFEPVWEALNQAERERLVRLLVGQVEYDAATESVTVTFHEGGLGAAPHQEGAQQEDDGCLQVA
jgi:site-specific DNA recombinase